MLEGHQSNKQGEHDPQTLQGRLPLPHQPEGTAIGWALVVPVGPRHEHDPTDDLNNADGPHLDAAKSKRREEEQESETTFDQSGAHGRQV